MGPTPHNYFEDDPRERFSSKKRVTPLVNSTGYRRFNNSEKVEAQIVDDLIAFERYAKFDVGSLEAVQIREAIIDEVNMATPAATFEGNLDDWQDLNNKENLETMQTMFSSNQDGEFKIEYSMANRNNQPVPAHLSQTETNAYKARLIERHDGQLG